VTQSHLDTIEKVFPCAVYLKIIQFSVCIYLFAFQFSLLLSDILHLLSELFSVICAFTFDVLPHLILTGLGVWLGLAPDRIHDHWS
jgi:hypothetical protein